jgi:hypothetical protein
MRRITPLSLIVPVAALLAAACDDSSNPIEPEETPVAEAEAPAAEPAGAALMDLPYWADGYLYARNEAGIVLAQAEASWSRSGGAITVTKVPGTTGRYVARFRSLTTLLGGKSTVHVTATGVSYGASYCKPVGAFLVRDSVEVRCFKIGSGAAANTDFSLDVLGKRADRAFAFANQPTATNYAPASAGSYNPAGATRVYRDGVGRYRVVFSGLGGYLPQGFGGHVQANAVGAGKVHCIVERWTGSPSPDLSVTVECYAPSGARADTKFTTMVTAPASHLAYVWADQPSLASYTPNSDYAFNPMGGSVTVTRTGVGAYTVRWVAVDGEIRDFGNAQVTAWGYDNAQCRLAYFDADAAHVRCYGASGAPMDTYYTVLLGS